MVSAIFFWGTSHFEFLKFKWGWMLDNLVEVLDIRLIVIDIHGKVLDIRLKVLDIHGEVIDTLTSHFKGTAESSGGVIRIGPVVVSEDRIIPAVAEKSAAQFTDAIRRLHPA